MRTTLCSDHRRPIVVSAWGWRSILEIAVAYGWRPLGTQPPLLPPPKEAAELQDVELVDVRDGSTGRTVQRVAIYASGFLADGGWNGNFTSSQGQLIAPTDALSLASALMAFVEDATARLDLFREDYIYEELCEVFGFADGSLVPDQYLEMPKRSDDALNAARAVLLHLHGYDPRKAAPRSRDAVTSENLSPEWVQQIDGVRDMCEQGAVRVW